jgi:A/G-specific adenine glycosylase
VALHGGVFPRTAQQLQTLPGIGRSTAAAIASFCFGERAAILDGNVKRVLTRVLGFANDLAQSANERLLWDLATGLLPEDNLSTAMPRYTQGLMDLGATVCTSRKPQCLLCPVQGLCMALATGQPEQFPVKTRKIKRSALGLSLLWAQRPDGAVWLEKRPVPGIWGGLYCLPVFDSDEALLAALPVSLHPELQPQPHFLHVLTHKDLHLAPWVARFAADQAMPDTVALAARSGAWFNLQAQATLGVPAPVRKLLAS